MAVARDAERVGPVDGPAQLAGVELTALRNVRLLDGSLADLDLAAGEITAVRAAEKKPSAGTDATGWRLIPAAGEPHAHLDKALTGAAGWTRSAGNDLVAAIAQWRALAARDRRRRHRRAGAGRRCAATSLDGITAIRTHVDVLRSTGDPLRGVDALLAPARAAARPGHAAGLPARRIGRPRRRAGRGASPAASTSSAAARTSPPDPHRETTRMLDLAERLGLPVDLHADEQTASHRPTRGSTSSTSPSRCSPAGCSSG